MTPRIINLSPKQLIGQKIEMNLVQNRTAQLWSQFAPRINEIEGKVDDDRYSLQVYDSAYFRAFNPQRSFTKWALVAVHKVTNIPNDMEAFELKGGLYAVFDYKGSSNDPSIFQYIYSEWLPKSEYQLDHRPHFEVLGANYKNNDPNSEEEIWIPIQLKN